MASHLQLVKPDPDAEAPDDYPFVVRALAGDVQAQAALFARHVQRLTTMLTRLLASTTDAEDAVQDTFAVAFTDLKKLRDLHAFGGWLWQIAVHQAHRRFRRRRFLRAFGLDQHVADATLEQLVDPRALPDVSADLGLIDQVLAQISGKDRTAWILRYVEGYELVEVAQLCGCSLATAKRRIAAGQGRLAKRLDLDGEGIGDE